MKQNCAACKAARAASRSAKWVKRESE